MPSAAAIFRGLSAAQDARSIQPWSSDPALQLALVQEAAGNYGAARRWTIRAIDRNRSNWFLWTIRARIETEMGLIKPLRGASIARASSIRGNRSCRPDVGIGVAAYSAWERRYGVGRTSVRGDGCRAGRGSRGEDEGRRSGTGGAPARLLFTTPGRIATTSYDVCWSPPTSPGSCARSVSQQRISHR